MAQVSLSRRVARATLPKRLRHELGTWWFELWIDRFPDRRYLKRVLLPTVARRGGKVLFVGCRRYTRRYPAIIEGSGAECWSIDIDPAVARWGVSGRHRIGAIQDGHRFWPAASFDTIVLHGVIGYGLDCEDDQEAALRTCHHLLRPSGWLILGWTDGLSADPEKVPFLRDYFKPVVEWRKTFGQFPIIIQTFSVVEA